MIRRCRAVTKLGPGGVQDWAGDVIAVLREAHRAVEAARARGDTALGQQALDGLRERYDTAVASGIIHNRLRDWDTGNHPGYALGTSGRNYEPALSNCSKRRYSAIPARQNMGNARFCRI